MTDLWQLPQSILLEDKPWVIHPDYRDILGVIGALGEESLLEEGRLYLALRLFYRDFPAMPRVLHKKALKAMLDFVAGGRPEDTSTPGTKLLDWQQDADLIISDVNRVAGCEIRAMPFVHWWTFLAWFGAVGEGRLSTVVSIRQKLKAGKKLEDWEKEYYRQNKARIQLKAPLSPSQQREKQRLEAMLLGKKEE